MLEAVAAAVVTALLSTGLAAAIAAARKASETRDAVLVLTTKVEALDARLGLSTSALQQQDQRLQLIERSTLRLESRVTALEAGVVDCRNPTP